MTDSGYSPEGAADLSSSACAVRDDRASQRSIRSIAVAVTSAFTLQFAASAAHAAAKDGHPAESVSIDQIIRETHSYVLQVPDVDRYRLKQSADWVLQSQSALPEPAAPTPVAVVPPALARKRFHAEITSAAQKAGVDPALVHAVIGVESAYRESAVSPKGAVGLMQVMPETGRRYGVENLTLPVHNLRAGTRYLSDLMRMFNGDLSLVLAAYNAGENAVIRYGGKVPPYPETMRYVPRVLGIYKSLGGATSSQPSK